MRDPRLPGRNGSDQRETIRTVEHVRQGTFRPRPAAVASSCISHGVLATKTPRHEDKRVKRKKKVRDGERLSLSIRILRSEIWNLRFEI